MSIQLDLTSNHYFVSRSQVRSLVEVPVSGQLRPCENATYKVSNNTEVIRALIATYRGIWEPYRMRAHRLHLT